MTSSGSALVAAARFRVREQNRAAARVEPALDIGEPVADEKRAGEVEIVRLRRLQQQLRRRLAVGRLGIVRRGEGMIERVDVIAVELALQLRVHRDEPARA